MPVGSHVEASCWTPAIFSRRRARRHTPEGADVNHAVRQDGAAAYLQAHRPDERQCDIQLLKHLSRDRKTGYTKTGYMEEAKTKIL